MYPIPYASVEYLMRELKHRSPQVEREHRNHVRAIATILAGPLRAWHAKRQGTEHAGSVAAAAPPGVRSGAGMGR
jgi:hypothetical protein